MLDVSLETARDVTLGGGAFGLGFVCEVNREEVLTWETGDRR